MIRNAERPRVAALLAVAAVLAAIVADAAVAFGLSPPGPMGLGATTVPERLIRPMRSGER